MSARITRNLLVWSGWIGLLLSVMPFYTTSEVARPTEANAISEISLPVLGAIPQESSQSRFTIGLPCSPWFRYEKTVVAETTRSGPTPAGDSVKVTSPDGQPGPPATIQVFATTATVNVSWRTPLPNWSALLMFASIALLILARWVPRRSKAMTASILKG